MWLVGNGLCSGLYLKSTLKVELLTISRNFLTLVKGSSFKISEAPDVKASKNRK